jgi:uncharacterized protein YbjT (DUF2867 family)
MSRLKVAAIAGATGLTGSYLLQLLIDDSRYEFIYVLGRRKPDVDSAKIIYLKTSFLDLDSQTITGVVDDLYCTLGTTIKKAGSQEAFRQVDYQAVDEFANWGLKYGATKMVVISSLGANARTGNFYLRTKGEMENRLKALNFRILYIVRPSLIVGQRAESRLGEGVGDVVLKILKPLLVGSLRKYRSIKATQLAKAMHQLGIKSKEGIFVVESDQLQLL